MSGGSGPCLALRSSEAGNSLAVQSFHCRGPEEASGNSLQTTALSLTCEEQQGPLGLQTNQHHLFEAHGVVEGDLEDPLPAGLQVDLNTVAGLAVGCVHHSRLLPSGQHIEVFTVNCVTSRVRGKL